ncbi:hypothetical protein V5799_004651, partial [Amblyomma americanum]
RRNRASKRRASEEGHWKSLPAKLGKAKVCLSALSVRELTLHGTVSVANLTYHKHVFVRYTTNEWQSHVDWPASYLPGSLADGVDQFAFALSVADAPLRCELAVCFETEDGRRYWDNNGGANYRFRRSRAAPAAAAAVDRASCRPQVSVTMRQLAPLALSTRCP